MAQADAEFGDAAALIDGLVHGDREVVFLLGSPLTAPIEIESAESASSGGEPTDRGDTPQPRYTPGVPGVGAMVDLIGAHIEETSKWGGAKRRRAFEAAIEDAEWGARYQQAFERLNKQGGGVDGCNTVIRRAVLQARTDGAGDPTDADALAALEADPDGWYLGPAVKALGHIVAGPDRRFGRRVLTTNFDPLIEVAIRAAGGHAATVARPGDGPLDPSPATGAQVVHLHGFWRGAGDTLHTPRALTVDRPRLRAALAALLDRCTLVVMAYGGWDDVITEALGEIATHGQGAPDIKWCFFESDHDAVRRANARLLATQGKLRDRMTVYAGIDCNTVLPDLRAALDREGELIGRQRLCEDIENALAKRHAVQILGEPYMKRSRTLAWAARAAAELKLEPVRINAGALARPEPEALVRAIADGLGRYREVDDALQRERAVPNVDDAIRCLPMIAGSCVLIDDADALFEVGHGFEARFFDVLRSMVGAGELQWVSVSRRPVNELFEETRNGESSAFLNDARTFHAGGLDPVETQRAFAARLGKYADAAFAAAGTLPKLVYRLIGAEWGDVAGTIATLGAWSEGLCAVWWARSDEERAVLGRAVDGIVVGALSAQERQVAQRLVDRGLMIERNGDFALNGSVWSDHVRAVG